MKRVYFVIISFICAVAFLSIMGFHYLSNGEDINPYPDSQQIVDRFAKSGVSFIKADLTPPFAMNTNFEVYTDGIYNYFIDTDNHILRLIDRVNNLQSTSVVLSNDDLNVKAISLFRKAYGYELVGDLEVVNHGSLGDTGSHVRIDIIERVNKVDTGNKAIIFLTPDGSVSRATFLPGAKPNEVEAMNKLSMITEENAKAIALDAAKSRTNATRFDIIDSMESPYKADIQTFNNITFWSIEFTADFVDGSEKARQAFFGVQVDAYTGRVLVVYSSIN